LVTGPRCSLPCVKGTLGSERKTLPQAPSLGATAGNSADVDDVGSMVHGYQKGKSDEMQNDFKMKPVYRGGA
jgi:hypothetical protein